MNFPDYPSSGKSPRRELQGPRPTPLKVRKDSHKIKKPPVVPHHHNQSQSQSQFQSQQFQHQSQQHQSHSQQQQQHRPPVIIYTVSPKVIHTNPNDFMNLVQRLTGSSSSSSSSTSYSSIPSPAATAATTSYSAFQDDGGAVSPAARFASIEKIKSPEGGMRRPLMQTGDMDMVEGVEISTGLEKPGYFPGILSPGPGSLPPIPPNFFSPSVDPNHFNSFFHDLSPVLHSNRNYIEGSFMPSPSNLLSSHINSPSSLDLFSNYFDF